MLGLWSTHSQNWQQAGLSLGVVISNDLGGLTVGPRMTQEDRHPRLVPTSLGMNLCAGHFHAVPQVCNLVSTTLHPNSACRHVPS